MNKLLILSPESEKYARFIEDRGLPGLGIVHTDDAATARTLCHGCNIILGQPGFVAGILPAAADLVWVQSTFAGVEPLCAENLPTDYMLTGVKEGFGPLISEYVFTYLLAMERNVLETVENQKNAAWEKPPYRGLRGLTLGVCGLGAIGEHVARTAAHFNMRVLGFNRSGGDNPHVERVFSGQELGPFLSRIDYLVITLPHTQHTRRLIDLAALRRMKPDSVLINVGRGSVVSEKDLIVALKEKIIRGAVLDVFEEEPLPAESPLWKMPSVFITPHNAAISFPETVVDIFCGNYLRFLQHEPLRYVIDFERGY